MSDGKPGRDIRIADIDVGGDIHRIVLDGIKVPSGLSAFEVRRLFSERHDVLRRFLLSYPFGNDDMCADLVFESAEDGVPFAHITMECMGYPHYSGSNCAATIAAILECGLLASEDGRHTLRHEVPSGIIEAKYRVEHGAVRDITVAGDDSFMMQDRRRFEVPGIGTFDGAIAWSGVGSIMVDAAALGIGIDEGHVDRMKAVGKALVESVRPGFRHEHPILGPLEPPSFVNFMGSCRKTGERHYEGAGACFGYPGTVFRCPTGTGTAARMMFEVDRGAMEPDAIFENVSPWGSRFTGHGLGWRTLGGREALGLEISMTPFVLSTLDLRVEFENPSLKAFAGLREIIGG